MSRIAIFGGSFNPPHVAHQLVALYVLETQLIDELWFVPTYSHPFGKELVAYEHRVAMCELAAAALGPRVKVSRAEEDRAGEPGFASSRTYDLLAYLAAHHPEHSWRFVIGTDILAETDKWYRWDDVVAMAPLIVVGRTGHPLPAGSAQTGIAMPEISATAAREMLARKDPAVSALLPRSVLLYVARHGLYT